MELLYESNNVWVYDKPANVSVLKDRSGDDDLWSELKQGPKPYLVHRLDKGTSGVWVVAKNQRIQSQLSQAFASRSVSKFYVALVEGQVPPGTHHVDLPLCRGRKSRFRIAGQRDQIRLQHNTYRVIQDREGVPAFTSFRTLKTTDRGSLLAIRPRTGRSHQIRVHMAWLGFPLVGDRLYNKRADSSDERLYLHAHYLKFSQYQPFISPLPEAFHV